jgi:hypothetical protein
LGPLWLSAGEKSRIDLKLSHVQSCARRCGVLMDPGR